MKKIFSLFILSLFLLSFVSLADAAYGRKYENSDKKCLCPDGYTQIEDLCDACPPASPECMLPLVKCEYLTSRDQQSKSRQMQERIDAAKTRKTEIDANAQTLREKCQAQATLEGNCGEAFTKIKEHLTKTVDRMIEALTNLKTRWTTTDATQTEQTTKIDAALTTLQSLKTEIAAAKTRAELKAVMTKVRESWVEYKQLFKEKKNDPYQQRAESMLKKAERIQTYLRQALPKVQASDSTALETTLKNIDAQIATVKTALAQGDKPTIKESLQKLHTLLQDAIQGFRQAGKGDAVATVTTAEPAPVAGVTP